jgi:concentrative nucleoside transporter, CNT family
MLERWIGAFGALVLLGIAYLACPRALRSHVRWRTIGWGMALLLGFALLVLKTPARVAFDWASAGVNRMLEFSAQGAAFVFGGLVTDTDEFGFVFAFQVLPTIIFFGAFMSLLYYLGVMPFVIDRLARLIARSLGTSGAESLSTVADIFVGQSEAPLVIRPYIATLTRSELMACMTAGFATTAGAVLAAYVLMLGDHVPDIAGHLIACSVMSAPASLVIAKLMLPESETPLTRADVPAAIPHPASGAIDAIATGTLDGLRLAVNVAAMLISFLALVALVNFCLDWAGRTLLGTPLSLERLLGWVFAPLAFVMGVPAADVTKVASLLGQKTVLNEFVAYTHMSQALAADPAWLSERGRVIASYALCGFANFGSIGIQIGGYSGLAPERRADIAALGLRAMIGGLLTTCLVATIAGVLV